MIAVPPTPPTPRPPRSASRGAQAASRKEHAASAEIPTTAGGKKKKTASVKRTVNKGTSGRSRRARVALEPSKGLDTTYAEPLTTQAREGDEREWKDRVRARRRRQASVSVVLDQTFGRFAESDPSLWDRRAYLMLVGIVYNRLANDEADIPTEELIALAKLLAESRRADSQSHAARVDTQTKERREDATANAPCATGNGRLPDAFGEVVRQIYGTNVPGAARA